MFAGPLGRSTFTPPKSSFDSPLYGLVSLRRSHTCRAGREPFGHTGRLEPKPRGVVTRRAVAQRRSRASGLTRPLAEAIRGFDSGFGLGFVVGPLARSAAVWCKSFFSASYQQDRCSYYLFFNYLFFNYLYVCPVSPKTQRANVSRFTENTAGECVPFHRGKLPRITQACGNKRLAALWPLRGSKHTGESNPAQKSR